MKKMNSSPSLSASKNMSPKKGTSKKGTSDVMNSISWRVQAESLFFVDGKIFKEISEIIGISTKSVSKYLRSLPRYFEEVELRKEANKQKKLEYHRELKRKQRAENAKKVEEKESLKREHVLAAKVLSSDKYF